jgi:AraC-like DNA-binding protein
VEELANAMRISRVQLFNRIKSLTSVPPANLIRTIRLENAKRLLEKGEGNISEVAYKVGFNNPNYFGKALKKHFGVPPSAVLQQ